MMVMMERIIEVGFVVGFMFSIEVMMVVVVYHVLSIWIFM